MDAKIISMRKDYDTNPEAPFAGFSIGYNNVRLDTSITASSYPLLENEWQHLTLVVDNKTREMASGSNIDIEDINRFACLRIYVNGTLVDMTPISIDNPTTFSNTLPMILNGSYKEGNIINQGTCEIQMMRCYSKALTSSDIYNNYLNSLNESAR
jgi:hypothetical protein